MLDLEIKIIQWANERGIFEHGTRAGQHTKTEEEILELREAIHAKDREAIKDAIGDSVVTLINQAHMNGFTLKECVEHAYNQIKDRKGTMIDGIFIKERGAE